MQAVPQNRSVRTRRIEPPRLPHFLLPVPRPYGHAVAYDETGRVVADWQDPSGHYPEVTGITEVGGTLYVHSLVAPALGLLKLKDTAMSSP